MAERIEILLSTIDDRIERIALNPADFPDIHFRIIHQITEGSSLRNPFANLSNVTLHQLGGHCGLSASRNAAIEATTGDICLFADDDVSYCPDLVKILLRAFADNPDADIITFQAISPEGTLLKSYPRKKTALTRWSAARVSSIEIAFRRQAIQDAGLKFDTRFGLGAFYPTGEEYIFLTDALKKGLKVIYVPEVIVIHPLESSGKRHDEMTTFARGAMMARVFGCWAFLLDTLFALKKWTEYRSQAPFIHYLFSLWRGSAFFLCQKRG